MGYDTVKVERRYRKGMTVEQIANDLDLSIETVVGVLREKGIDPPKSRLLSAALRLRGEGWATESIARLLGIRHLRVAEWFRNVRKEREQEEKAALRTQVFEDRLRHALSGTIIG